MRSGCAIAFAWYPVALMKLIASGRVGMMLAAMTMIAGCGAAQRPGTTTVTSASTTDTREPMAPVNASSLKPAPWENELDVAPPDTAASPTWGTRAVAATPALAAPRSR